MKTACAIVSLLTLTGAVRGQVILEVTSALGTKFYSQPDEKGVVAAAQKKLAADPNNVDLILKLAQAQAGIWQYREAVATCTRALATAPDNADVLLERGHRELGLREFDHARADLHRAAALAPKNMGVFYHMGLAHYFLGEFALAAEAFGQAVALAADDKGRIDATNWEYASLRRADEPVKAATILARITPEITTGDPHVQLYLNLVRFFQGAMKEADALPPEPAADSKDIELGLRFETVAYGVGNWHLYHHNLAKAREYFQKVVRPGVWVTWGFVGAERELAQKTK